MSPPLELRKLSAYRRQLEDEGLGELSFEDAFRECLALMELSFDMVESLASPAELKRIQSERPDVRHFRRARQRKQRARSRPSTDR